MIKFIKKYLRNFYLTIMHTIGRMTTRWRMTPNFIIIGAQKGGTSSLFYYLKFHPQIKRPIKKEIQFFNLFHKKGLKWYLGHFPIKSKNHISGEASPDYIFHPKSALRIKRFYPNIKLIVLLRNPIERAYSAYNMNKRLGIDSRISFEEAVKFELDNQEKYQEDYNYTKHYYFYLQRGKYAQQLSDWMKHFNESQLLLIDSHKFFANTSEILEHVYEFLEIEKVLPPTLAPMNVGSYSTISDEFYTGLKKYFKQDVLLLKKKWGFDLQL